MFSPAADNREDIINNSVETNETIIDGTVSKTVGACFKWHKRLANLVLTTDDDKLVYLKQYNCNPPPLFILFVSLAELVMFIYYGVQAEHNQWITISQGLVNTPLIYDPWKRKEVWRFISYMFLHAGIEHILGNVILQLVIGIMLEMVHKSSRVCTVYMSGVLAGRLKKDPLKYC